MVKKKVLIVDDDEVIREFLLFNLDQLGYEVLVASDGVEAILRVLEEETIDFVVLDLMMPNLGGRNTLKILKRLKPDLPIAVCTGYLDMEDLLGEAGNNDVVGSLSKPFSFEQLETLLRAHC